MSTSSSRPITILLGGIGMCILLFYNIMCFRFARKKNTQKLDGVAIIVHLCHPTNGYNYNNLW